MAKYFVKVYDSLISDARSFTKSELLTFLWLAIHADSRGNIVYLDEHCFKLLLVYVGIGRSSMYNVLSNLKKKGYISKHGDMIILNSEYANKHKMNAKQFVTPYNSSFIELGF